MTAPAILQIIPSLIAGGAEQSCLDMAVAIKAAGGSSFVASSGGPMVRSLQRAGIEHITLPLATKNPFKIWLNSYRLIKIIKKYHINILHFRSRAPAWSAVRAARKTGIKLVTTFHAAYKFNGRVKKYYNAIMTRGDRVIAISPFIADHITTHYNIDASKIRVIPRGIDLWRFNPSDVSVERVIALAEKWRLPEDLFIVLLPGRLTRIKGHRVFLEALTHLKRQDMRCIIVGSEKKQGTYRAELERFIKNHHLSQMVQIVDHCEDMEAVYSLASVVLAPSIIPEGFGRVAVEAQAMGKPVIATDLGGHRDTILHGKTGWLFPSEDSKALASLLDQVLNLSEKERAEVADRATVHVKAHFDKDVMCQAVLDVYEELLDETHSDH